MRKLTGVASILIGKHDANLPCSGEVKLKRDEERGKRDTSVVCSIGWHGVHV